MKVSTRILSTLIMSKQSATSKACNIPASPFTTGGFHQALHPAWEYLGCWSRPQHSPAHCCCGSALWKPVCCDPCWCCCCSGNPNCKIVAINFNPHMQESRREGYVAVLPKLETVTSKSITYRYLSFYASLFYVILNLRVLESRQIFHLCFLFTYISNISLSGQ